MPTVQNQNIIAVLPELVRVVRGHANSINLSLHENYIGHHLNIGIANEVK